MSDEVTIPKDLEQFESMTSTEQRQLYDQAPDVWRKWRPEWGMWGGQNQWMAELLNVQNIASPLLIAISRWEACVIITVTGN